MKIDNVTTTKTEKIYTLTEEELERLKNRCKDYGSRKTREYISFCLSHYPLQMNIGGAVDVFTNICRFSSGRTDYIPNIYSWDLFQWLRSNRE